MTRSVCNIVYENVKVLEVYIGVKTVSKEEVLQNAASKYWGTKIDNMVEEQARSAASKL